MANTPGSVGRWLKPPLAPLGGSPCAASPAAGLVNQGSIPSQPSPSAADFSFGAGGKRAPGSGGNAAFSFKKGMLRQERWHSPGLSFGPRRTSSSPGGAPPAAKGGDTPSLFQKQPQAAQPESCSTAPEASSTAQQAEVNDEEEHADLDFTAHQTSQAIEAALLALTGRS